MQYSGGRDRELRPVAGVGDLPTTNVFNLQTMDALTNARSVFATTTVTTVSTGPTVGANLLFGIDNTAPTQAVTGPPNNSSNCPVRSVVQPGHVRGSEQAGWCAFSDAGVGPSGFGPNPVTAPRSSCILASGTTCYNATATPATALISCTTNGGVYADDGNVLAYGQPADR